MGYFFHLLSLYPAPYIELYMCWPISISYFDFKAVLALPKMARSDQTHKSRSLIQIVLSTLYVYLFVWTRNTLLNVFTYLPQSLHTYLAKSSLHIGLLSSVTKNSVPSKDWGHMEQTKQFGW